MVRRYVSDDDEEVISEIEAKLEILRARAQAYEEFVSPPGQPPLLGQMAMLADAGFTILPPVRDADPERSFPEVTVALSEANWSADHCCLVGGERFSVVSVPPSYHGHLMRPKTRRLAYFTASAAPAPVSYDVEHFRRHDFAVVFGGDVRWRSRIMICMGSAAEDAIAERTPRRD